MARVEKRPHPALLKALQTETEMGARSVCKPPWLKVKVPGGPNYRRLKALMQDLGLHTM